MLDARTPHFPEVPMRSIRCFLVTVVVAAASLPIVAPSAAAATACFGEKPTIVGTNRDDRLRGTAGRDVIQALDGNDQIRGLGGNDLLCGDRG